MAFTVWHLQASRNVWRRLWKQTSAFTTFKNNLSGIHISQGVYWGFPSLYPYFLLIFGVVIQIKVLVRIVLSWGAVYGKVVPTFESSEVSIQMKASKQYFRAVLRFIKLYKVVLTFESVNKIPKCDHSNESYWVVLSCGTVHYPIQGGSNFWVCE